MVPLAKWAVYPPKGFPDPQAPEGLFGSRFRTSYLSFYFSIKYAEYYWTITIFGGPPSGPFLLPQPHKVGAHN